MQPVARHHHGGEIDECDRDDVKPTRAGDSSNQKLRCSSGFTPCSHAFEIKTFEIAFDRAEFGNRYASRHEFGEQRAGGFVAAFEHKFELQRIDRNRVQPASKSSTL